MRERKRALERLVAVKTQMQRLEEARLAEMEKQRGQARQDRDAMIGFLDRAEGNDRLVLSLACKRVVAAERGAARLEAEAAEQRQVLQRRGAQKLSAEKMLKAAAAALARDEEKRALLEIAERVAAAGSTSLP